MTTIDVHIRFLPTKESAWRNGPSHVSPKGRSETYQFTHVHGPTSTNAEVFRTISPMIGQVAMGVNVTVMAYGQTGSGKTHTMVGDSCDGVFYLASSLMIKELQAVYGSELRLSYIEIYNEQVRDLLASPTQDIDVRENGEGDVVLDKLSWQTFTTIEELQTILKRGERERAVASTNINNRSSRSHTILTIDMVRKGTSDRCMGVLNLVDLAGSENAGKANTAGTQLREGGFINKSLLALGNVVDAITEGRTHIPYRESKLTRILSNSLGGNARTAIICCVNPEPVNFDQSTAVLRFAQRAQRVRTHPTSQSTQPPQFIIEDMHRFHTLTTEIKSKESTALVAGYYDGYKAAVKAGMDVANVVTSKMADEMNEVIEREENLFARAVDAIEQEAEKLRQELKTVQTEKSQLKHMTDRETAQIQANKDSIHKLQLKLGDVTGELEETDRGIEAVLGMIHVREKELSNLKDRMKVKKSDEEAKLAQVMKQCGIAMTRSQEALRTLETNQQHRERRTKELELARVESDQLDMQIADLEHEILCMKSTERRRTAQRTQNHGTAALLTQKKEAEHVLDEKLRQAKEQRDALLIQSKEIPAGGKALPTPSQMLQGPPPCVMGELSLVLESPATARRKKKTR